MTDRKNPVSCPCKKESCPRHGDCDACRRHHAESNRKRPVYCMKKFPSADSKTGTKLLFPM